MNPVRIRQQIASLHKDGLITKEFATELFDAPLFTCDLGDLEDTEVQWVRDNLCDRGFTPRRFPFPSFAALCAAKGAYGIDRHLLLVRRTDSATYIGMSETLDRQDVFVEVVFPDDSDEAHGRLWVNKKLRRKETIPAACGYMDGAGNLAFLFPRDLLLEIAFALMNPSNAIIRVEPPLAGRSVEWRMARTHYLLLTRPQAVKCRDDNRDR
jgi:hypothetical protein